MEQGQAPQEEWDRKKRAHGQKVGSLQGGGSVYLERQALWGKEGPLGHFKLSLSI